MALQGIHRDNGPNIVGDYDSVVSRSETDCDVMGPDRTVARGRFRHSFELYEGRPITILPRQPSLVLVIEFHDERNGSFREGVEFADIPSMVTFVREYDPISHIPADSRTPEEVLQLSKRYQERSKRFLNLAEERALSPSSNSLS